MSRKEKRAFLEAVAADNASGAIFYKFPILPQPGPGYQVLTNKDLLLDLLLGQSRISEYGTGYLVNLHDMAALAQTCRRVYQMLRSNGNLQFMRIAWNGYIASGGKQSWGQDTAYVCFGRYLRSQTTVPHIVWSNAAFVFKHLLERFKHDLFDFWSNPANVRAGIHMSYGHLPELINAISDCSCTESTAAMFLRQFCAFIASYAHSNSLVHRVPDIIAGIARSSGPGSNALAASVNDGNGAQNWRLLMDTTLEWWGIRPLPGKKTALNLGLVESWGNLYLYKECLSRRNTSEAHHNCRNFFVRSLVDACFRLSENPSCFAYALDLFQAEYYPNGSRISTQEWIDSVSFPGAFQRGDPRNHIRNIFIAACENSSLAALVWLLNHVKSTSYAFRAFCWIVARRAKSLHLDWIRIPEVVAKIDYTDAEVRRSIYGCLWMAGAEEVEDRENSFMTIGRYVREKLEAAAQN